MIRQGDPRSIAGCGSIGADLARRTSGARSSRSPSWQRNEDTIAREEIQMFKELTEELLDLQAVVRGYGAAVYAANEDGGGGNACCCCCCCWGNG